MDSTLPLKFRILQAFNVAKNPLVALFIISMFIFVSCNSNTGPNFTEYNTGPYLLSYNNLELIRPLLDSDTFYKNEYETLIQGADSLLNISFEYVTDKKELPPSGDPHDFVSLHRYSFMDENGAYTIIKDGQTNPEIYNFDKHKLEILSSASYTFSLAYYYSGEEKYAEKATEIIENWFLNSDTRMNPNMNYAGIRPGVNEIGNGIMGANDFINIIEAVSLIYPSHHWTPENHYKLKNWFYEFYRWLSTRFPKDYNQQSNISTWLDAQRVIYLLFIEEDLKINSYKYVEPINNRIRNHIDSNGFQVHEATRGASQQYVYYNLKGYMNLSLLRKNAFLKNGNDRDWPHLRDCFQESCEGFSLKAALDNLASYVKNENVMLLFNENHDFDRRRYIEIFKPAVLLFENENYEEVVEKLVNEGYSHPDIFLTHPPLEVIK